MSNPVNVLDQFRTYSYHHFLIVANNTEALRQLQTGDLSFSGLSALQHGEKITAKDGRTSIVMVINSEVDSKYFIDNVQYTTQYIAVSEAGKQMTAATKIAMTIRETGGAEFLNFMRKLCDEILQTSLSSCCLLLKTFFVGHRYDGTVSAPIGIEPIPLLLANMDSSFDHTGGIHNLTLFGMSNGAPLQINSLLYVNRNLNLVTSDNSILLKDMIRDLETKLNQQLEDQYNVVQKDTGGNGRKVKYKITIPEDWDHYTVKCTTKDNFVEKLFPKEKQAVSTTSTPTANSSVPSQNDGDRFKSHINTAVKVTVVQVLAEIFKHCDQIHQNLVDNLKLKTGEQQTKLAKLHQTVTSITSDDQLITVHFDVVNYFLPQLPAKEKDALVTNKTKDVTPEQKKQLEQEQVTADAQRHADEAKYGIVFDYIFSGKNTDIITFDIKANHTNVLLQSNRPGVTKATRDAVKNASTDMTKSKDPNKNTAAIVPMRKFDAVYLPELPAEAQQGYIYAAPESAKLRDDYVKTLALLVALTTEQSHLTIRGNPIFLNQIVMPIMPHEDEAYKKELKERNDKAQERAQKMIGEYDAAKSTSYLAEVPSQVPLFAKINIYTPVVKNGVTTYEQFWYQGYYRITHIENKFSNGDFIQELYMKPWDLNDLDLDKT